MDEWTTGVYIQELINQAEAAQIAVDDINSALANQAAGTARAFAAAQSLLGASAMISKMLWPMPSKLNPDGSTLAAEDESRRETTLARGKILRAVLNIKSIPLLQSRKVRNALEHFDDRLDRYFEDGNRMVVDRNIGPRNQLVVFDGSPALHLRLIDTEAGTISVLEDEVSMQELFDAVMDVRTRAVQWAARRSP